VAVWEYPSERAEHRLLAPAVGGTAAGDCTHLLDEPADDREQQVQRECPHDDASHEASLGLDARKGPDLVSCGLGVGADQVAYPPGVAVGGVEVLGSVYEPAQLGSEALELADATV
jgi:hypothetical protein